jgi:hypothetical protein
LKFYKDNISKSPQKVGHGNCILGKNNTEANHELYEACLNNDDYDGRFCVKL